ncbi:MAG: lamin tail domain-containing protein [Bacteroidales bacterium]|nr:lamin tail domain-containing protein [Bacteroidales bacterium]
MKKILFAALALIVVMASCVKDPKYPGVNITNVTYNPAVQADVPVVVKATITSFNKFTAKLVYTIDTLAPVEVEMTGVDNLYTAEIPGKPDDTSVKFYVMAEGEGNLVSVSETKEYVVGAIAIDYSKLRLNELNGQDHKKFIEIFNAGDVEINMKGVNIIKDSKKTVWTGVSEIVIAPNEYLVLRSEDVVNDFPELDTIYVFKSGLSAKKNVRIQLMTPAGESIDDFNLVDIDQNDPSMIPAPDPISYSRNADGAWYYADETPGAVNNEGTVKVLGLEGGPEGPNYKNIVLNELNGSKGKKFIEFYNKGNLPLSMAGMYLEKDDKTEPIWVADASIEIPAHGYLLLYSEDVQLDHPEIDSIYFFHSGLSSKKTVRIELFMADGTSRDIYTRGNAEVGWNVALTTDVDPKSFARTPDGGDWKLADATPGEANPAEGEDIPQE